MSVTFEIDPSRRLVLTAISGGVTPDEMMAYHSALREDPAFSPDFACLTEYAAASSFVGTPDDIRRLVEALPFNPGTRRAYVASGDLHFGLSRMAQHFGEARGIVVGVFRNREEAVSWLDRPADPP